MIASNLFIFPENINSFVKITYDEKTTSFFCRFLNQQDTTDIISCSIKYVQCQRKSISVPKQQNATTTGVPNVLQIVLTSDDFDEATYCYDLEATNSSYTMHIDGTLNFGKKAIFLTIIMWAANLSHIIIGHSSGVANTRGAVIGGSISCIVLVIVVSLIGKQNMHVQCHIAIHELL